MTTYEANPLIRRQGTDMTIKHALVVDDSKSAGLMLRRMLEQHSMMVDVAESAEAALAYLGGQQPDIVFMDHIMPGMNGLEAAKAISTNPVTAAIPIVMYTSTEGDAYVQKARAHGAVAILPKPPKADLLKRILQQVGNGGAKNAPKAPTVIPLTPPHASMPTALTSEAIEELARRTAEAVVQTLVTRVLQEQLSELRQDLIARCEDVARQAAVELNQVQETELMIRVQEKLQDQIEELRESGAAPSSLTPALLEEVTKVARSVATRDATEAATQTAQRVAQQAARDVAKHTASDTAKQVAAEVYTSRANALADQLRDHVRDQLADVNARLAEPATVSPAILDDIRSMARSAAKQEAVDTATQTALRVAQQSVHELAGRTAKDAAQQAATEVLNARIDPLASQLSAQLKEQMDERLAEFRALLTKPTRLAPEAEEEIKQAARAAAAQAAVEATAHAVQKATGQSAQDIGKQAAKLAVRQLEGALAAFESQQATRMAIFAAGAALVGVLASVVVFLLK
jgi:CheY-like chemotaxis protein